MTRHDPVVRLRHMRDFGRRALRLAQGRHREELDTDEQFGLSIARLVELLGEAAARVPAEVRAAHPQLPWPRIVGIRNRLIHGYDYVDHDILWGVLQEDLPELLAELDRILPPDEPKANAG